MNLLANKANKCCEIRYSINIINVRYRRLSAPPRKNHGYQTTVDNDLKNKQRYFPKLTRQIFIQNEEVKTYDGFALVEPLIDKTKEPHKLHLIKKIKKIGGEPWWVKEALEKLGFERMSKGEWKKTYSIKPNTPEINNLLWLCKHCVRVTPIELTNGEPSEKDIGYTKLNLNTGKFEIIKQLESFKINENTCYKVNDVTVTKDIPNSKTFPLDKKEINRHLHEKRAKLQLNKEYTPTVFEYKHDQDKPGVVNVKGLPDTRLSEDE